MRFRHGFRPWRLEVLESRAVPAQAGAGLPTLLDQVIALPPSLRQSAPVQQAFSTFLQNYTHAVESVLFAPGPGGTINPAGNLSAFDAAVRTALVQLSTDLTNALNNSPAGSSLVSGVQQSILGNGPNSLQSRLLALSTTFLGTGITPQTVIAGASPVIAQAAARVNLLVLAPSRPLVTQAGADLNPEPVVIQAQHTTAALDAVGRGREAYTQFLRAYFQAADSVLTGPAGANPAASRTVFDAKVAQSLKTLDARILAALNELGAGATLSTRVHTTLLGNGPDSLQSRLNGLPTPDAANPASVSRFNFSAAQIIGRSMAEISADLIGSWPGN
jgi:hypothetical protein